MRKDFNQKQSNNQASSLSGADLLIRAYEEMPVPKARTKDLNHAIKAISYWKVIAKDNPYLKQHTILFYHDDDNRPYTFGDGSQKENWSRLVIWEPVRVVRYTNLWQITDTIRKHLQKNPAIPNHKLTVKALHDCIQAGQYLMALLRQPRDMYRGIKQENVLPALKDLCGAIELLSSDIMGLDPKITTALKNGMLDPPINSTVLDDYLATNPKQKDQQATSEKKRLWQRKSSTHERPKKKRKEKEYMGLWDSLEEAMEFCEVQRRVKQGLLIWDTEEQYTEFLNKRPPYNKKEPSTEYRIARPRPRI